MNVQHDVLFFSSDQKSISFSVNLSLMATLKMPTLVHTFLVVPQ